MNETLIGMKDICDVLQKIEEQLSDIGSHNNSLTLKVNHFSELNSKSHDEMLGNIKDD